MQKSIRTLLLALPFFAAACSTDAGDGSRPAAGSIRVTIGSGPRIEVQSQSRTELDENGQTIRWTEGDKIALWAVNSLSEHTLSAVPFEMLHYNQTYDDAKFTADITAMPLEERYDYYAVAPRPAATQELKASFKIPAVQDGTFDGAYDVMVADPIPGGGALTAGDNSQRIKLRFTHKVHVLMIRIPTSALGEPIKELALTFPTPVTGRLTVDAANPQAAPTLDGGENTLTLRFAEPKEAGATVYAIIAPVTFTDTDAIEIKAAGQNYESQPAYMPGKNFAEGRTTPILYNVPERAKAFTYLRFSLPEDGTATLGEPIRSFTLTAPEGSVFDNGTNVRTVAVDGPGEYSIRFTDFVDNLSGQQIAVSYESEHAIVAGTTFAMPQLAAETTNEIVPALAVPYLMQENFDTVETFSDNEGTTGINDPAAIWIPGISGWSAARAGGEAGKCVRIVGHREGFIAYVSYEARMDSAPLSALKEGANVKIKVSFDFSGSSNKNSPWLKYGTSTAAGLINGANADIANQIGDFSIGSYGALDGSYDNVPYNMTYDATGCTNQTRLAWVSYGKDNAMGLFYYVYIDNIKVSIVP